MKILAGSHNRKTTALAILASLPQHPFHHFLLKVVIESKLGQSVLGEDVDHPLQRLHQAVAPLGHHGRRDPLLRTWWRPSALDPLGLRLPALHLHLEGKKVEPGHENRWRGAASPLWRAVHVSWPGTVPFPL